MLTYGPEATNVQHQTRTVCYLASVSLVKVRAGSISSGSCTTNEGAGKYSDTAIASNG